MQFLLLIFAYHIFQILLESVADVLSDWLDKQLGSQITENSIFAELPKLYEKKFHEDMDALNVGFQAVQIVT